MIKVRGNLINEEKVLSVVPFTKKEYPPYPSDGVNVHYLEITFEGQEKAIIKATLKDYEEANNEMS